MEKAGYLLVSWHNEINSWARGLQLVTRPFGSLSQMPSGCWGSWDMPLVSRCDPPFSSALVSSVSGEPSSTSKDDWSCSLSSVKAQRVVLEMKQNIANDLCPVLGLWNIPGRSTVMASCTACLSRLSRANIQCGLTCCCRSTFFTFRDNPLNMTALLAIWIWRWKFYYSKHCKWTVTYSILEAEECRLQAAERNCVIVQTGAQLQESVGQLLSVWRADVFS